MFGGGGASYCSFSSGRCLHAFVSIEDCILSLLNSPPDAATIPHRRNMFVPANPRKTVTVTFRAPLQVPNPGLAVASKQHCRAKQEQ